MHRIKFPLAFILSCIAMLAHAQTDTTFWFAAPEVAQTGPANDFDRPIVFRITTYTQPATVTISQPAGGGMPPQVVTIAANSTQTVDVTNWIDVIESKPPNTILNYGLKLQSTAPVTAYYDVISTQCLCNPEIFILKGANALGTDFWIPGQNFLDNGASYYPTPFNAFDIVATQNNTTVTITPSNDITGHAAGTPFNIILNEGQVYSATAVSQSAALHLQGSRVVSDKPITINVKDDLLGGGIYGNCFDLTGDQIVPTNILGTEYIAMNGELNAPYDKLFITATQNGTAISQDGVNVTTINTGQTFSLAINNPSTYIQTSQPAYVWQLSGIGCEMGSAILPQITCSGSTSVSFTNSSSEQLFVNLMVKNGGQGNFLINGVAGVVTAGQFAAVPGTGGAWYAAHVSLSVVQYPLGSVVAVTNTTSVFHLGLLNGGGNSGTSFGYFSNFGSVSVSVTSATDVCVGQPINLGANTVPGGTYSWTGPNGFTSTSQNPVIPIATIADSGWYHVNVNANGCGSDDSFLVNVHSLPIVAVTPSVDSICGNANVTLTATGANSYTWSPATGLNTTTGSTVIATPTSTIEYIITGTNAFNCTNTDSAFISVNPSDSATISASICSDTSYFFAGHTLTASGTYTNTFTLASGCDSVVTLHLQVTDTPQIMSFSAPSVCLGGNVEVSELMPVQSLTYTWDLNGATVISGSDAGPYTLNWSDTGRKIITVTGTNSCGSVTTSDTLDIYAKPNAGILSSTAKGVLCGGDTITFTAFSAANYSYNWQPANFFLNNNASQVAGIITASGYVILSVTDDNKCTASDSLLLDVDVCCHISMPSAFTPNKDGRNDMYRIITISHDQLVFFRIVDRFGEVVFETKNLGDGWDGTFKGVPLDVGTYYYVLKYKCVDGKVLMQKGDLALIR